MRLLSWNVNHRAARHALPPWLSTAIGNESPDVVVLTEYVVGPDHLRFVGDLESMGFSQPSVSERPKRQNQVLIATREPHVKRDLRVPVISQAVPSNVLSVGLERSGVSVVGFRMPAYKSKEREKKREVWNWLQQTATGLLGEPSVIAGDFNTAVGDSASYCGDCLDALCESGWTRCATTGPGWRGKNGIERAIDHAFVSPRVRPTASRYSWDFQSLAPEAKSGNVGVPDHAMLIVDFDVQR